MNKPDDETLAFYDRAAIDQVDRFAPGKPDADLLAFVAAVPPGGLVLDFGCGPGRSAALLRDAGLRVEATDASPGMIGIARDRFGIEARLETFDDLTARDRYDGIWANFSLLHAPRADLSGHLTRIHTALKPKGILHLALILGEGEKRDRLGRFYSYFTETELAQKLAASGFSIRSRRIAAVRGEDSIFILADA